MDHQQFKISYDGGQSETATLHDIMQWPEMANRGLNRRMLSDVASGKLRRLSTSSYGIPCDVELKR